MNPGAGGREDAATGPGAAPDPAPTPSSALASTSGPEPLRASDPPPPASGQVPQPVSDRVPPASGPTPQPPDRALVARYALALGDDALIHAQRLAEWVTRAPTLEDDVALANLGLDLLGQARALLTYAGRLQGAGRDEDDLAYQRDDHEFTNVRLVELPNGDFAVSIARLLAFAVYRRLLLERLSTSADPTLAAIAGKAVPEIAYHVDYARGWLVRLGDGTEESHRRLQAGLTTVWPYVDELFTDVDAFEPLVADGVAVAASALRPAWDVELGAALTEATLTLPEAGRADRQTRGAARQSGGAASQTGGADPQTEGADPQARGADPQIGPGGSPPAGRLGRHTEHLAPLLATLQEVHRAPPGVSW